MRRNAVEIDTLMPWVKFTKNFDWQPPNAKWMMAFKAGTVRLVKQIIANQAIKEGKAVQAERPVRKNASR